MIKTIIDASVAVKWFIPEAGSERANDLFEAEHKFYVPELFFIELDAVLTKYVRVGTLSKDRFKLIDDFLEEINFQVLDYSNLRSLAVEIATKLPVALYDAVYLASAVKENGCVITADQKLVNGLSNTILKRYVKNIWDT